LWVAKEVDMAQPGWDDQRGLIDRLGPGSHHRPSECGSLGEIEPFARNLNDINSPCLE
jgi:hypothetical protein